MASWMPPVLTPLKIVLIGCLVAAAWGAVSTTAESDGLTGVAVLITLGLTLGLAAAVGRQRERSHYLETQAQLLRQMLDRLFAIAVDSPLKPNDVKGIPLATQFSEMASTCHDLHTTLVELQNERARLAVVLESLDCGVIVVAPQERLVMANAAAGKYFSTSSATIGKPFSEAVQQPELLAAVRQVSDDHSPREVVVDLRDGAGIRRVLRVLCVAMPYERDVSAVLLLATDESEIREVEETRREFVANVSHELKTPLAAIKGYVETAELAIEDDPEAAQYFVSQIHDQCRRLESLVSDMMTLARAQAGTQHLRPTAVDLDAVIAESIATYTPVAGAKRISLTHDRAAEPAVMVLADREATITIINNVIGNAIRYTPEGGQVVANAEREEGRGVISVRDTGIGIPQHEQRRVFERFYRAEKSRQHTSSGTGLGLAIVKNLTQAQGGQVRLWSQPGKGSQFDILLPIMAASQTASVTSQTGKSPANLHHSFTEV